MGPFIFLDTETTGFDPATERIIEIACIKWHDGKILDRFESLVNPGTFLPYEITLLTGIQDNDCKGAPRFSEIKETVQKFLGEFPIIGHNIGFDTSFLKTHHCEIKNEEIDTQVLARILLRKEASYALEVLMKKYGLPLAASHRAMVDVETTVRFFEFLQSKIEAIPETIWDPITALLLKSDWAAKPVFLTGRSSVKVHQARAKERAKATAKATAAEDKIKLRNSTPHFWDKKIFDDFLNNGKILLESPNEIPFHLIKEPVVLCFASQRKRNALFTAAKEAGVSIQKLKESPFYLSPKKLTVQLNAKEIDVSTAPFLLKMLLWNAETETGDREEISLDWQEYGLFDLVSDTAGEDIFWKKALQHAKQCIAVLIHQYWLAHGLPKKLCEGRRLIVTEASKLEDSFTFAQKKKFTEAHLRPFLGEKATVIFGLLGILYEHFVEKDYAWTAGQVIINETILSSLHWKQLIDAVSNLPEHEKKTELLSSLLKRENTLSWISFFGDEIAWNSIPISVADQFKNVVAAFSSILLHSIALRGNETFDYIKSVFALGPEWKEYREQVTPQGEDAESELLIPANLPEPNTEGYFRKCLELFSEILEEKDGKSLIIMGSKKAAEAMYRQLLPEAQKRHAKLLGVGLSGGRGKSLALFLEHKGPAMLLATPQIIDHLAEIEHVLHTIAFQRIPFDPFEDPVHKTRAAQFENGFNDYSLPRAVIKFRELLFELKKSGAKKIYLLDCRIKTKKYGAQFLI